MTHSNGEVSTVTTSLTLHAHLNCPEFIEIYVAIRRPKIDSERNEIIFVKIF